MLKNLTCSEWISNVIGQALADRVVVDGKALGVFATGTRAGILALLVHAGHVSGTFLVHGTFRSENEMCTFHLLRKLERLQIL